jgi:hypothetical protein
MHGSIRQRSNGSYEPRVFTGTDPASGQRRFRSKTVLGPIKRPSLMLVCRVLCSTSDGSPSDSYCGAYCGREQQRGDDATAEHEQ